MNHECIQNLIIIKRKPKFRKATNGENDRQQKAVYRGSSQGTSKDTISSWALILINTQWVDADKPFCLHCQLTIGYCSRQFLCKFVLRESLRDPLSKHQGWQLRDEAVGNWYINHRKDHIVSGMAIEFRIYLLLGDVHILRKQFSATSDQFRHWKMFFNTSVRN